MPSPWPIARRHAGEGVVVEPVGNLGSEGMLCLPSSGEYVWSGYNGIAGLGCI
jgi:hypothetical protein